MAVYRRGAVYWWKSSIKFQITNVHPITIRMSLRTCSAHAARTRAAALDLARADVMEEVQSARRNVSSEDLPKIFRRAFERELDRVILAQVEEPGRSDLHLALNRHYARYFTLLATEPRLATGELEHLEEFIDRGLPAAEAEGLVLIANRHRDRPAVSPGQIAVDLRAEGIEPTENNMRQVGRIIAAGYRNANIAACEHLGTPLVASEIWPLPPVLDRLAPLEQQAQPTVPASSRPEKFANSQTTDLVVPSSPAEHKASGPTLSEIAELSLKIRIESDAIDQERQRDVRAAVAIFIAANGDIPFSGIRQEHLIHMAALFPRLPVHYGREYKNSAGERVRETIAEALVRGDELRQKWKADPVKADEENLPYVGLSLVTQKKHLTWLSSVITFAEGQASVECPEGLNFPAVRKSLVQPKNQGDRYATKGGKKKNQFGLPWKEGELRRLFDAPIWHGCAGLWSRFEPGPTVFHDGCYWVLPLLATSGARSDEIAGLSVADVVFDQGVPYVHIRPTALRRIKTIESERRVPIASILLDLGFEEYWRGIKAAGHEALFPEYKHPTRDFEHCFWRTAFAPLRKHVFPNGTSRKTGRKDVDVRSIRPMCTNVLLAEHERTKDPSFDKPHRKALLGHEQGDTTGKIYEDDYDPKHLVPMVEHLATLLPPLPKHPLNLRPEEWQRFGSPRGRPRKS